ncbi:hypothetical protein CQ018_19350 [Arthrobacter sp. MYb227]|uniref:FAD/NAD(P)-binding protein n=1 Tax=Arthrobacter sp. MYb227 TaxID=1848601 RepID=UPI000CFE23F2|nr:FAD/NAD(P)-binding protein [Arthrobacter sp. MYb227]PQZ85939.1 hypothetical protein CQ018_19350 [Arthrobacter sp. MYb227]
MSEQQNFGKDPYTIAVVGAGPRGTSVLERIEAVLKDSQHRGRMLRVLIFEPFEPGAGRVWSTAQSRLFLMNTPALFPTVAPERVQDGEPGLSFEQWRALGGDGALLSSVESEELAGLSRGSYPPRALYGRYLRHVFDTVISALKVLPQIAEVQILRAEVRHLEQTDLGYELRAQPMSTQYPHPAVEGEVENFTVDAVVLALGHVPAHLNPAQSVIAAAAQDANLSYQGPNVPSDVAWERIRPGQRVLVRGLGLNFFDVMVALTVGRGGEFRQVNGGPGRELEYWSSGNEPKIMAASRRGTPYRAKSCIDDFIAPSVKLEYFDSEVIIQKIAEQRAINPDAAASFEAHVWPLLHRDVLLAYYRTAAERVPGRFLIDPQEFVSRLIAVLDAEHQEGSKVWVSKAQRLVTEFAPELGFLDVQGLGHPFAGRGFTSAKEYQRSVREYLEADALASAGGEKDPLKLAIGTLNAGRMVLKNMIAEGLISDASRLSEVQGWFEPLVEGLASGPPVQRIEELAALARAGIVEFIGPDPEFGIDPVSQVFTAASPWVDAPNYTAPALVEAMMPANRVLQTASPLLRQLLDDELASPLIMRSTEGEPIQGQGLDVVGTPYRMVDAHGLAHRAIFVIGLQLSSAQWGTAIAAQAGAAFDDAARTLGDAQDIAHELVRLSQI